MNDLSISLVNPKEGDFLKRIDWNKEEVTAQLDAIAAKYTATVIQTADDYKAAKKDRTALNKLSKALSDRRIEVKKAVMEPYDIFEDELNEAMKSVKKTVSSIDEGIKKYEKAEKDEKRARIEKAFESHIYPYVDGFDVQEISWLTLDRIFNQKWLNSSYKMTQIDNDLTGIICKIEEDVKMILDLETEPDIRTAALDEYKRTMDLSHAMQLNNRLLKESNRRREEARKREEAEKERQTQEEHRRQIEELKDRLSKSPSEGKTVPEQINPQAAAENATQGQNGGKSGHSVQDDNVIRKSENTRNNFIERPETESEKEYLTQFKFEGTTDQLRLLIWHVKEKGLGLNIVVKCWGTKAQLMELRQYMMNNGIGCGPVQ